MKFSTSCGFAGRLLLGGTPYPTTRPHDGREKVAFGQVDEATLDETITLGRSAEPAMREMTSTERSKALHLLADKIAEEALTFTQLESGQTGKPHWQMEQRELPHIIDVFRYYANLALTLQPHETDAIPGCQTTIRRRPAGLTALILPWNYPLMIAAWKIAPALAAGCPVIVKPDPKTPASALHLAYLAKDVFPQGALSVVIGDHRVGRAIASDPRVRMVSVTGSRSAGRKVALYCASDSKGTHLELGGNCPAYVDASVTRESMTRLADAIVFNAGQSCAAPSRIVTIGSRPDSDAIVDALYAELKRRRCGPPDEANVDYGPQITVAARDDLMARLTQASGTLLAAGRETPDVGSYMRPQLLLYPDAADAIHEKELFGPTVSVQNAPSLEDALGMAEADTHGLAASVWSQDQEVVNAITTTVRAGEVWVNTCLEQVPGLPHTATGISGNATDLTESTMHAFTYEQAVTVRGAR